jgi:VIT1/CCC1 family predicted Fe2+/Mn2+ transporter
VLVIIFLSSYSSVVLDRPFRRSFLKILLLGGGAAFISYLVGSVLDAYFDIPI